MKPERSYSIFSSLSLASSSYCRCTTDLQAIMGTLSHPHQAPSAGQRLSLHGHTWRLLLLGSLIVTGFYFNPWLLNRWLANSQRTPCSQRHCAQPNPPAKRSTYSDAYQSPEFKIKSALRLSGSVKIPTMFVLAVTLLTLMYLMNHTTGPLMTWDLLTKMSAGSHSPSSIGISRSHFQLCM